MPGTGRSSATFGTEYLNVHNVSVVSPRSSPSRSSSPVPLSRRSRSRVPLPPTRVASFPSTPSRRLPAPTRAPAASSATRYQGDELLLHGHALRNLSAPAVAARPVHLRRPRRMSPARSRDPVRGAGQQSFTATGLDQLPEASLLADLQANPKSILRQRPHPRHSRVGRSPRPAEVSLTPLVRSRQHAAIDRGAELGAASSVVMRLTRSAVLGGLASTQPPTLGERGTGVKTPPRGRPRPQGMCYAATWTPVDRTTRQSRGRPSGRSESVEPQRPGRPLISVPRGHADDRARMGVRRRAVTGLV